MCLATARLRRDAARCGSLRIYQDLLSRAGVRQSLLRNRRSCILQQKKSCGQQRENAGHGNRCPHVLAGMAEIANDMPPVVSGNQSESRIAKGASAEDCAKELAHPVSESSGGQQEHRRRTGRRSNRGNEDRAVSPTIKSIFNLAGAARSKLFLEPGAAGLASEFVGEIGADQRAQRRSARVVEP